MTSAHNLLAFIVSGEKSGEEFLFWSSLSGVL
uniref:Uncharacterized protein n=1 Tax=Trichinella nativa TaxID=6335 RepID=A0A0V1JSD1_9BILA